MRYFDLSVILLYLIGITWFGSRFRSNQKTLRDYFLGGRNAPWWAIAFSIVSAETSTLTVIGTPGIAFNGAILSIGFNRPGKKNALTSARYAAMADALATAAADSEVRVVLFHGSRAVFTAGNDLEDFAERPPTGGRAQGPPAVGLVVPQGHAQALGGDLHVDAAVGQQ